MVRIRDDEFRLAEDVTRVTRACAVKIWNTVEVWTAFGPTLEEAHQNYRDVVADRHALYQARQTAYVEGREPG